MLLSHNMSVFSTSMLLIPVHIWYKLSPIDNLRESFHGNKYESVLMFIYSNNNSNILNLYFQFYDGK